MFAQLLYQTFRVVCEISRKFNFFFHGHFEDLVSIRSHEWWCAVDELIDEDAKSVPVSCLVISLVEDDFWGYVLWRSTE